MIKCVLLALVNHSPSDEAVSFFEKIKIGMEGVQVSVRTIITNADLKSSRKKYRFKDLPCLKITGDSEVYYRDKLYVKIREIKQASNRRRSRKGLSQAIKVQRSDDMVRLRARHDNSKRCAKEANGHSSDN